MSDTIRLIGGLNRERSLNLTMVLVGQLGPPYLLLSPLPLLEAKKRAPNPAYKLNGNSLKKKYILSYSNEMSY